MQNEHNLRRGESIERGAKQAPHVSLIERNRGAGRDIRTLHANSLIGLAQLLGSSLVFHHDAAGSARGFRQECEHVLLSERRGRGGGNAFWCTSGGAKNQAERGDQEPLGSHKSPTSPQPRPPGECPEARSPQRGFPP